MTTEVILTVERDGKTPYLVTLLVHPYHSGARLLTLGKRLVARRTHTGLWFNFSQLPLTQEHFTICELVYERMKRRAS